MFEGRYDTLPWQLGSDRSSRSVRFFGQLYVHQHHQGDCNNHHHHNNDDDNNKNKNHDNNKARCMYLIIKVNCVVVAGGPEGVHMTGSRGGGRGGEGG